MRTSLRTRPTLKPNSVSTPSPLTRSVGSTVELSGEVKKNAFGALWNSFTWHRVHGVLFTMHGTRQQTTALCHLG